MGWAVQGFESLHAQEIFCPQPSRPVLHPTQASVKWALEALSPGVSKPGRESGHSPPSSTKVGQDWMYSSFPPIFLHGGQVHIIFHSSTCEHCSLLGCDAV